MTDPIRKRSNDFTETEVDGEVIVLHLGTGDFFSLTGTGREIWRLIDGTRDREAVLAALAAGYETEETGMAGEVDGFLSELRNAGLLGDG
jgi:pyrroloquinoline quinone biosynthesis protein D